MIQSSEFGRRRSPRQLRESVEQLKETVRGDDIERHRGILKKGAYKQFLEELVPLSYFAVLAYPDDYGVQYVLGNQGYDALVFDEVGREVDRVELTAPHDGRAAGHDAALVVERGFGKVSVGKPGDDFDALVEHVLTTCRRKAQKDYGDCTLVVAIAPLPSFARFEDRYERQVASLVGQLSQTDFKAKRVFLLILPDRLEAVHAKKRLPDGRASRTSESVGVNSRYARDKPEGPAVARRARRPPSGLPATGRALPRGRFASLCAGQS